MSRLDYAPKLKEIEITDIKKGLAVFTPKPEEPVSFAALKETLKKAGYTLGAAEITVAGTIAKDDIGWAIIVQTSKQRFALEGPNVDQAISAAKVGESIELSGDWKTVGIGPAQYGLNTDLEYVIPREERKPGGELFLILETTVCSSRDGSGQ